MDRQLGVHLIFKAPGNFARMFEREKNKQTAGGGQLDCCSCLTVMAPGHYNDESFC